MSDRANHHPNCYQNTGVPTDMPANICDCGVLRMLDLAHKAGAAERRAEEAEYHVEQLRAALDRAERRIERVESALVHNDHEVRDGHGAHRSGRRQLGAEVRSALEVDGAPAHACLHHWLDRPESDTRECLICGTEVSG